MLLGGKRRRSRGFELVVYSDAASLGGAEHSLGHLLAGLSESADVTVMGVHAEVVEALAARRPGANTRVVPRVHGKRDVPAIKEHLRALRELRPDIFHANLPTPWSCAYGIAAALMTSGVGVLAVEHLPIPTASPLQRSLKRLTSLRLDRHVAVGHRSARVLEHVVGLPAGSVDTVHNGVPDEDYAPVARPGGGPVVGSLGRLADHKGYDVLVRALTDLPGVTAMLVGDGPERGPLERLAAELGVEDRLIITGWSDEACRYLTAFDVFVLPSRYEGFPLSILEAMLQGIPVVASDVGSVRESVRHEETGLLVPPQSPAALAGALERLLADRPLCERMGRCGRAVARKHFTAEVMASRFESLYEDIVGQAVRRRDRLFGGHGASVPPAQVENVPLLEDAAGSALR